MRLDGRPEVALDAEVDLHLAVLEPDAPALREFRGLRSFRYAEQLAVEAPGFRLPPRGHGELDVVDADDGHVDVSVPTDMP